MTLENFTTYIEVEPDDRIQKTANHIDFLAYESEDAYLYDSKGSGHFTNFEHLVTVRMVSSEAGVGGGVWAVSTDSVDDIKGWVANNKTGLFVLCYAPSVSTFRIYMGEAYAGGEYLDYWAGGSLNTTYYLRIEKDGTAFTCKIYDTEANRTANGATGLLDTLTLTLQADHSFDYVFGAITYRTGDVAYGVIDIDDLDLQEVVALDTAGGIATITKILGITSLTIPKFKPLFPKFKPRMVI